MVALHPSKSRQASSNRSKPRSIATDVPAAPPAVGADTAVETETVDGAVGHVTAGPWRGCDVVVVTYRNRAGRPVAWEFRFSDVDPRENPVPPEEFEALIHDRGDAFEFLNALAVTWYSSDEGDRLRREVFHLRPPLVARLLDWVLRR